MQTIVLPAKVKRILDTLHAAGFEAYAVGGCVRDSLIGRKPGDWDITTSALPEKTKALFRRTVDTGVAHGTVTVMLGDEGFEVTTFRLDGAYTDARHPDSVSFTASLAEDLKRRDFTINAMAYAEDGGIVDLFGGMADLEKGIIRAVGDPMERFDEDALRILRAVRFSAQLGFSIEENTFAAIRHFAPRLQLISRERIREEFVKLLVSPHPEYVLRLVDCGIMREICPAFETMLQTPQNTPYHRYDVGMHTVGVLKAVEPTAVMRLAAFLHDTGKPERRTTDENGQDHFKGHAVNGAKITEAFLTDLRFDNKTVRTVTKLVAVHDDRYEATPEMVRRELNRVGLELFPDYLKFIEADNLAKSESAMASFAKRLEKIRAYYREILERGDCCFLKDLAVTGNDLIARGMKPGKAVGEALNAMLDDVLTEPSHNTKEYLLSHFCS